MMTICDGCGYITLLMMTTASMMIFNLMTKMMLIIGNANYDNKDENDDDNGGVAGPRWTRLHHSTLLWSVLLPWQVWSCPFFLIIIEMVILAMRMNSYIFSGSCDSTNCYSSTPHTPNSGEYIVIIIIFSFIITIIIIIVIIDDTLLR